MKKFTFKGVLDGFRSSVGNQPTKSEPELVETLRSEHLHLARTARHGFPHQPTALAYDPIQRLVAIGTKSGALRILGRPGVSVHVRHEATSEGSAAASDRDRSAGLDRAGSASSINPPGGAGSGGGVGVGVGGVGSGGSASAAVSSGSLTNQPQSNTSASSGYSSGYSSALGSASGGSASSLSAGGAGSATAAGVSGAGASGGAPGSGSAGATVGPAVLQIQFLINEGALITATADDAIHLWNIRQKRPEIVHSLKFQRERITCFHLPFQSKWLYVGTERGNIHVINIESFTISGYIINWNKAIELCRKTHPGPVVHLSDCPTDPGKLLIGYESGLVVLWDLRTKTADCRFQGAEPLRSVAWLSDGKQLVTAHADGSLVTWSSRPSPKPVPVSTGYPHAKAGRDGKPETCKAIQKVDWKSSQSGDPFMIFSGGLPTDRPGRSASITVIHGRSTTVLEMEHNVVDFVTLTDSPWPSETQDPHGIIVLLQNDLVIVDLLSPGFPCFENPYPMDIHEAAVTCCLYVADCPGDLIPALYSVGAQGHRLAGFSEREWPVSGGEWGAMAPSYAEIIITGHADGTVKFWDSSSLSLQVLYRMKTSKVFDKSRISKNSRADGVEPSLMDDNSKHLSVQRLAMCPEGRLLAVAGASGHVMLFKFRRQESSQETTVLNVPLFFESDDPLSPSFAQAAANLELSPRKEQPNPLKPRAGPYRRPPGFLADLVCLSPWMDGEAPGLVTSVNVNSAYGLMAFGNDGGMVVVDIIQKSVLLSMASSDLYSSADPYTRLPRSPKRQDAFNDTSDQCRSPSTDQTAEPAANEAAPEEAAAVVQDVATVDDSATGAAPDDDKNGARSNKATPKKKNFGIKKKLIRADTKIRDLITSVSAATANRRGSAPGPIRSPTVPFTLSQSENPAEDFTFVHWEPPARPVNHVSEPLESKSEGNLCQETGGAPVRPPRKSKRRPLQTAAGAVTKWPSNDGVLDVLDLRFDSDDQSGHSGFLDNIVRKFNKSDSAFARSRSSSTSSLENQTSEAITTLTFADTLARKLDTAVSASLWVGTSQGSLLVILINLPAPGEPRLTQPVMVSPSGSIFRVKGSLISVAFLDSNGVLVGNPTESWRDEIKETRERSRTPTRLPPSAPGAAAAAAPGADATPSGDTQLAVVVSEKQGRLISLPSQTCLYRVNLAPDNGFVVTSGVIALKEGPCLASFLSNGHVQAHTLPSLRPVLDTELVPLNELSFQAKKPQTLVDPMLNMWGHQVLANEETDHIARNFRFSSHGHGMFLCSPSEIEKFTISTEFAANLTDLMGELFLPCEMPEAPKEGLGASLLRGLFGGGTRVFDREELFGESATGKASKGVARVIPGSGANLAALNSQATGVAAEVMKTRQALTERGDKLGLLEEKTQRLANEAEAFSAAAHQLMVKCRDRKWYQL